VTILDRARHGRLGNLPHCGTCLDTVATAFRAERGDPEAVLFASDNRGAIHVREITHRNILRLRQETVLAREPLPVVATKRAPDPGAATAEWGGGHAAMSLGVSAGIAASLG
jgi:hypothetical protein